jgi:hypothetical protein
VLEEKEAFYILHHGLTDLWQFRCHSLRQHLSLWYTICGAGRFNLGLLYLDIIVDQVNIADQADLGTWWRPLQ